MDEARLTEQQVRGCGIPRWPLVKNQEDLTGKQAAQLAEIRRRYPQVAQFHWVKEQLLSRILFTVYRRRTMWP